MRLIKQLMAGLGLMVAVMSAVASPASPVDGTDYRTLDKVQPTASGNKIEVTEFFWYACPHCNAFDPALSDWVKKQGDNIVFKRVPVAFRDSFVPQQKLYYALEAMGKLEALHPKIFYAIHAGRQALDTDSAVANFVEKQGIDKKKFLEAYNSFGVQTKARRATQLQNEYRIDSVPMIAIDGRYLTSPGIAGIGLGRGASEQAMQSAALQVMSWLVAKSKEQKTQVAAPVAEPAAK
jgi:protein dithiol oxidoreductase (disulfide-forming)